MKKSKLMMAALAAGAVLMLPAMTHATGISGTVHDFTTTTNQAYWLNGKPFEANASHASVCSSCHTIHHAPDPARGPLWIHTPTANTFVYYSAAISESFPQDVTIASLGSSSLTCLGCHDGSVAINSQDSGVVPNTVTTLIGGSPLYIATNAIVVEVNAAEGTPGQDDLTHMHPIGVSYTACQSSPNLPVGSLHALSTPFTGANGVTVANVLKGPSENVECASCHDIHCTIGAATSGTGIFTIASGANLCLGCHNK